MPRILFIFFIFVWATNAMQKMLPPYLASDHEWAEKTLKSLTLTEKIGQLFVVPAASNFNQPTEMLASSMQASPYTMDQEYVGQLIKQHHVGGVIFLYKSDPETQMALTEKFQKKAKIPLLIAQDCEWGLSMRLDCDPTKVVRYPRNMTLGALTDEQLVYQVAHEIGRQCAAIGVHMNLAPVVDVNNNPRNPVIGDRSFGDDPQRVARLGMLFVRGLQDAGIIACAKHFPGHGDITVDSHIALPVVDRTREQLQAVELVPFQKLINGGVGAVMTAHLYVPHFDPTEHQPSSMSYPIITEELKNNLGFEGLVITDGLGMQAVTNHYQPGELELQAFLAGNDILLCPLDVPRAVTLIKQAIVSGRSSETELDKRVLKILRAKAWVLSQQKLYDDEKHPTDYIIRDEAIALQETLYSNAITMVKNTVPISFDCRLVEYSCLVQVGEMPENMFSRMLENYRRVHCYSSAFSEQELEHCLHQAKDAGIIIIGIGQMNKFPEKQFGISERLPLMISELKRMGKKIVIVLFGTPYSIPYVTDADTIILAYEDTVPAQEGAAAVLLGRIQALGTLPINIVV